MRRVAIIGGLVVAAMVAAAVVALLLLDPNDYRGPIEAQASAALGRPVELGDLEFGLLPMPAVRVGDVRVAGDRAGSADLLAVDEVRLRIALLPLLVGQLAVGAIEIESPTITLAVDAEGTPLLPAFGADSEAGAPSGSPSEAAPSEPTEAGPALWVDRIQLRGGRVVAGARSLENVEIDGRLSADGSADLSYAFDLPDAGQVREGRVHLAGLNGADWTAEVAGRLEEGSLARLLELATAEPAEYGAQTTANFEGSLRAGELEAAHLRVDLRDLTSTSEDLELGGNAWLEGRLGRDWTLDLSETRLATPSSSKREGTVLRLVGALPSLDLAALQSVLVELPGNQLTVNVVERGELYRLEVADSELRLAPLGSLLPIPLDGLVRLESLAIEPLPELAVHGRLELVGVSTPLEAGTLIATGDVWGRGDFLEAKDLHVSVADQTAQTDLRYDLASGALATSLDVDEQDLEAFALAFTGERDVAGAVTLSTDLALDTSSEDPLTGLSGKGSLAIHPGRIRGFSMLQQVFGALAQAPLLVGQMQGRDMSRWQEEEFESLTASFRIQGGIVRTDDLVLVYSGGTAELAGAVRLSDGALDLTGRVVLARKADEDLGGEGRKTVIPIAGVRGSLDRPRVILDQRAVGAVASSYVQDERVRETLDRTLGPGGADAVEGLLNRVLGGGAPAQDPDDE